MFCLANPSLGSNLFTNKAPAVEQLADREAIASMCSQLVSLAFVEEQSWNLLDDTRKSPACGGQKVGVKWLHPKNYPGPIMQGSCRQLEPLLHACFSNLTRRQKFKDQKIKIRLFVPRRVANVSNASSRPGSQSSGGCVPSKRPFACFILCCVCVSCMFDWFRALAAQTILQRFCIV